MQPNSKLMPGWHNQQLMIYLAIVVSEFNSEITFKMLEGARDHAANVSAKVSYIMYVPGTFDMPLAVERLLRKKNVDAVVTLGAVIKGDTRHDDIVAENAARLIADLSLKHGKPVTLGVAGPGMTIEQARARAKLMPTRAVNAAVNMVLRLRKLQKAVGGGIVITNGLDADDHLHIQHELTKLYDNMLMSMTIGAGKTAFEANLNAYRTRKEGRRMIDGNARIFGSVHSQADVAQIMHIDIDSSAKVGNRLSPYELTVLVMKIYTRLAEEFLKHNSLAFFLGGDNIMVISNGMTKEQADEVLKRVTAGNDIKLNCGIGIGKTGRRAAEAATKALDTIRDLREEGKIQTIYEIQCPW